MSQEKIYLKFNRALKYRKLSRILIPVGVVLVLFSTIIETIWAGPIGGMIVAAGAALSIIFWRCPDCRKPLPPRNGAQSIKSCPYCGTKLQE